MSPLHPPLGGRPSVTPYRIPVRMQLTLTCEDPETVEQAGPDWEKLEVVTRLRMWGMKRAIADVAFSPAVNIDTALEEVRRRHPPPAGAVWEIRMMPSTRQQ